MRHLIQKGGVMGTVVGLNGVEVGAYVVELVGGLRLRLGLDDWDRLGLYRGQVVSVRLARRADLRLVIADITDVPPVVWITLVRRP